MEMYHFVSRWRFNAPIELVWKQIEDIGSWTGWTRDFKKAKVRGPERTAHAGTIADYAVRGSLPYTLRFTMEVISLQQPSSMELRSTGDLAGTGKWVLEPQEGGTATVVTYYWDVGTTNQLFNLASRLSFVRAIMEKNHGRIMSHAERGLKSILERGVPNREEDNPASITAQGSKAGIGVFLLLAFGGAWLTWGAAWLLGAFKTDSSIGQVAVALGAFAPALASVVVRRWVTREGFADAGLGLSIRGHWPYYLFGWLIPLPVVWMIATLATALGLNSVHSDLSPLLILTAVAGSLVSAPIFMGEELGWRGYLQLRVFTGRPLLAACATGLVWGVFHYPVILAGFEGYENVYLGLAIFPVFTILLSIIFGWLRLRTDSVWVTCLAHSASNGIGGSLTAYLYFGGGSFLLTSYAGVLGWLPLGAICVWIVLTRQLDRVTAFRQQLPAGRESLEGYSNANQ